jgi:hypothetical protein
VYCESGMEKTHPKTQGEANRDRRYR